MPITKVVNLELTNNETTTVTHLIDALTQFPPDMPVWTEGCDCWGNAVRVETWDDKLILIGRDN